MPFSEVLGHARPLGLLSRSIARGSLPPSLLFTGPEGVGKRLVAQAVAEALNCLSPVGASTEACATGTLVASAIGVAPASVPANLPFDACGACAACKRIAKGTYPDVLRPGASDTGVIKIEPVREVVAAAAYRPFEGRRRVIIIDDADRLNADAQDALLKSLEEPGASSVFILVSARPETLLPTIRSRCARMRFGRLSAAEVTRVLVERHGMDPDEAHAIAAVADGSPGRALEAGSKAYREARTAALAALRTAAKASSPRARLQAATGLTAGKLTSAGEREELATRITMLASLLRDVALVSQGGGPAELANGDLAADLEELGAAFGSERALQAFAAADRAISALRRNASPKVVAAWLSVHM
jgi:DNA polymerase-3 subunit delta'